jgi:hypothetical protein
LSIHKALNVPDVIARSKRLLSKEARQLRVGLALVKSLPKFSVCGSVGFKRGGLSTTDQNILIWFPIVETLFPVCGIPCGSGLPSTLYATIPKRLTGRIHSYQPLAVHVCLKGGLGVIFLCAGFSTQSLSFVSLFSPKQFNLRSLGAVGAVHQRHRDCSLKVEAAPHTFQATNRKEAEFVIS